MQAPGDGGTGLGGDAAADVPALGGEKRLRTTIIDYLPVTKPA